MKIINGRARFSGRQDGRSRDGDRHQVVRAENVVIATGSRATELSGLAFGDKVIFLGPRRCPFDAASRDTRRSGRRLYWPGARHGLRQGSARKSPSSKRRRRYSRATTAISRALSKSGLVNWASS